MNRSGIRIRRRGRRVDPADRKSMGPVVVAAVECRVYHVYGVSTVKSAQLIREKMLKRSGRSLGQRAYIIPLWMPFEGIQGLQKSEMPRANKEVALSTASFQRRSRVVPVSNGGRCFTVMGLAAESRGERACKSRQQNWDSGSNLARRT